MEDGSSKPQVQGKGWHQGDGSTSRKIQWNNQEAIEALKAFL